MSVPSTFVQRAILQLINGGDFVAVDVLHSHFVAGEGVEFVRPFRLRFRRAEPFRERLDSFRLFGAYGQHVSRMPMYSAM